MSKPHRITETSILERIRKSASLGSKKNPRKAALRVGIGDDAALWQPRPTYETILTCDWFLEGTHFLADRHAPEVVAYKCLARAVSDIAAMGGEPRCFLLSLTVPAERENEWLSEFLSALRQASQTLGCPLAGGDTTRQRKILINITVVGECKRGHAILREGAKPGDAIFVTGRLGEAEYGLRLLRNNRKRVNLGDKQLRKHLFPEPRLTVGSWLAKRRLATAMIDLSDGLSSDLLKLCRASKVGSVIEQRKLPCVEIAAKDSGRKFSPMEFALHGGDDYELLFTVAKKNVGHIPRTIGRVPVTQIGEITSVKRIFLMSQDGSSKELKPKGWDPFR